MRLDQRLEDWKSYKMPAEDICEEFFSRSLSRLNEYSLFPLFSPGYSSLPWLKPSHPSLPRLEPSHFSLPWLKPVISLFYGSGLAIPLFPASGLGTPSFAQGRKLQGGEGDRQWGSLWAIFSTCFKLLWTFSRMVSRHVWEIPRPSNDYPRQLLGPFRGVSFSENVHWCLPAILEVTLDNFFFLGRERRGSWTGHYGAPEVPGA